MGKEPRVPLTPLEFPSSVGTPVLPNDRLTEAGSHNKPRPRHEGHIIFVNPEFWRQRILKVLSQPSKNGLIHHKYVSTNHLSLLYALFLITRVFLALLFLSDVQMNVVIDSVKHAHLNIPELCQALHHPSDFRNLDSLPP